MNTEAVLKSIFEIINGPGKTKLANVCHTMMSSVTLAPEKLGRKDFEDSCAALSKLKVTQFKNKSEMLMLFHYLSTYFCNILFLIIFMFVYSVFEDCKYSQGNPNMICRPGNISSYY